MIIFLHGRVAKNSALASIFSYETGNKADNAQGTIS